MATDLLPAAATFLPERSPGCTAADRVVSCPLGALAPGASASATVAFAIAATGSAVNTAVVVGEQPDPQRLNDVAAAAVTVAAPPADGPTPPGAMPTPPPPGGNGPTPAPPAARLVVSARALAARAVPRAAARRCPRRTAAALTIVSSHAASATVSATRRRVTVASRRVALRAGRTTVVLCLNARGLRAAGTGGGALDATARVAAGSTAAGRAVATVRARFVRR